MNNSDIKILAFNLPQYHTFPENDKWWGKGFTEWTNVKKATPLYKNHYQPKIPLNDNYYDLSNIDNILWQMNLAKQYGIYGFIYYHYWFNGKLLMQKPLELLRDYKGEKINYCLCWANEPWTRAWDGKDKDVIMPQSYGDKTDWENHFRYYLPFFNDNYYIKINNKPMLVIYRTNSIPNCDEMIKYWNDRCIEEGFDGLYFVEELNSFQNESVCNSSDALLEFEPGNTVVYSRNYINKFIDKIYTKYFSIINHRHFNHILSYNNIWNLILKHKRNIDNKKIIPGAFVGWDNSPRKPLKSMIYKGFTPESFRKNLKKQINITKSLNKYQTQKGFDNNAFIAINAWNEWSEGAYLEPDQKYKYKVLEIVKELVEDD